MKRKKLVTLIGSVCLILVLAALPFMTACPAPEEEEPPPVEEEEEEEEELPPIKVGLIAALGDISGDNANKGALLAQEEINAAGGILGRSLEVIVVDDEMTPEEGAAAVHKLATVDNVDAFICGSFSGVHMGEIPAFKIYERVTLVTGAASHVCEEAVGADADWYFHLHSWDYMQGASFKDNWQAVIEAHPEIKYDNWFLAYEEGGFGTASFAMSQAQYEGWANLTGESFKSAALGGGDYSAVLEHAKAEVPDVFGWVGYAADALPIVEQAKAIRFAPPLFIGSPPGWPPDFGESPLSEAVVGYEVWTEALTEVSDVSKSFYDNYVEMWGKGPDNYLAPLAYTAVHVLAEAMERAGTTETEALIAALEKTEYESPTMEIITFSPSRIIKHQAPLTPMICQFQSGEMEVIYPWERASSELIYPFPSWEGR